MSDCRDCPHYGLAWTVASSGQKANVEGDYCAQLEGYISPIQMDECPVIDETEAED